MATVVRSPFYVPSPPSSIDEWRSSPTRSLLLQPILTKQKIFGAGGQVPTKQWRWDYDDASVWNWEPPPCAFLLQLTKKPPTKNWKGVYDYDSASFWQGSPDAANLRNLVNSVGTPQKPKQWQWNTDDQGSWSLNNDRNLSLLNTLQATSPFPSRPWNVPTLETPSWQQTLTGQNLSLLWLTAQPPTPEWRYDSGTSDEWQARFSINSALYQSQQAVATPFVNRWQFPTVDVSPWQYQATAYPRIPEVIPPPPTTEFHNLPFLVTVGRLRSM